MIIDSFGDTQISVSPPSRRNFRRYLFAGPVRYTRHFSPTVGRLTALNDERLYSTWKVYLKGVPHFFDDNFQHWNTGYKAAQTIFGAGPTSIAVRSSIRSGHRLLYARSTRDGYGPIESYEDVLKLLHGGKGTSDGRVKPAVYTYIIDATEDSLRFSETGAAFFVDFASKHALHANCAETVRYSGEFHPRPVTKDGLAGWEYLKDDMTDSDVDWEIVVDNNSGTYSPDKTLLPKLKELLEFNFSDLRIVALDRLDPELEKSREACRAYALQRRGIKEDELQPHKHAGEGEETLEHHASTHKPEREKAEEQVPQREGSLSLYQPEYLDYPDASEVFSPGAVKEAQHHAQHSMEQMSINDTQEAQRTLPNEGQKQPSLSQRLDDEFSAFMKK